MDPDANLSRQQEILADLEKWVDSGGDLDLELVAELCTLVQGLNGWLGAGGHLPKAWTRFPRG